MGLFAIIECQFNEPFMAVIRTSSRNLRGGVEDQVRESKGRFMRLKHGNQGREKNPEGTDSISMNAIEFFGIVKELKQETLISTLEF
jgi:hypothetical protein